MKKFLKSPWGIVCIIVAGLLILGGAAVAANQLWYNAQPKFQDVTVELGATAPAVDEYMLPMANPEKTVLVTELTDEQLAKAGDVSVTLRHGKQEHTVALHIVDTTAPTAEFLTYRVEPAGYVPKPEDFVLESYDLAETTVFFEQAPEIPSDYSDLVLTVVVMDASGNQISGECTVRYAWMYESVTLELGQPLTAEMILLEPEKSELLLDEAQLEQINTAGVGEYTLTCTSGGNTAECTVTVVDTTAPTVVLEEHHIYRGGRVKLEDFVVSAEDLSGEVTLELIADYDRYTLGTYPVQVIATDVHGNTVTAETFVHVVTDATPPHIDGLSNMQVEKNSSPDFLKGVKAYDNRDGYCEVTVDLSQVDLTKHGTYYAVYTAVDTSGNKATAKRKVVVNHDAADTAALVAEVAQSIGSDPEALRDYVRNKIRYTGSWGGDDPVWYGLTSKVGNCYVHNLTLQALLRYYGYETRLIWVTNKSHYWLIINLGGTWYHIDGTPGRVHTRYSLMNDEERLATLSGRDWDRSKWPACG